MDDGRTAPRLSTWQAALCMAGLPLAMAIAALALLAIGLHDMERLSFDCLPSDPPADCPLAE